MVFAAAMAACSVTLIKSCSSSWSRTMSARLSRQLRRRSGGRGVGGMGGLGGGDGGIERRDAGDRLAEDQGMDVVGALVGVDRLDVEHVTDHRVVVDDAFGAEHLA